MSKINEILNLKVNASLLEERIGIEFEKKALLYSEISITPLFTNINLFFFSLKFFLDDESGFTERVKELASEYGFKKNINVQIKKVRDLDKNIEYIATKIKEQIESGKKYKKVCIYFLEKLMSFGFVGVLITISGKLGGRKKSKQFFQKGNVSSANFEHKTKRITTNAGILGLYIKVVKTKINKIDSVLFVDK